MTRSSYLLRVGSAVVSDRSASTQRSYSGVKGGVVVHSSLTGTLFPASTGTGSRLSRSFGAGGRDFFVRFVVGWAVLRQCWEESRVKGDQ